jgi:hypothetical protein
VSRNERTFLATLGLLVPVVLACLGAGLFIRATPQGHQRLMVLPSTAPGRPRPLLTLDNCLPGIVVRGLAGGLLGPRARAERVKPKPTASYVPLYTRPICLAGPVIQTDRPRTHGLGTKKDIVCRAGGSTPEPAEDGYRYAVVSGDYPCMNRHVGRVFYS